MASRGWPCRALVLGAEPSAAHPRRHVGGRWRPSSTGSARSTWRSPPTSRRRSAFFDQGLRLLYAFNHQEARRAFREAARLDPALAMAYWGQAMALAPNLNAPMTPEKRPRGASTAIQQARATAAARQRARSAR